MKTARSCRRPDQDADRAEDEPVDNAIGQGRQSGQLKPEPGETKPARQLDNKTTPASRALAALLARKISQNEPKPRP